MWPGETQCDCLVCLVMPSFCSHTDRPCPLICIHCTSAHLFHSNSCCPAFPLCYSLTHLNCSFPNIYFYRGALRNGVKAQQRTAPFHTLPDPLQSQGKLSSHTSQDPAARKAPPQTPLQEPAAVKPSPPAAMGPLVVWDVAEGREGRGKGGSLTNAAEAQAAAALYKGG